MKVIIDPGHGGADPGAVHPDGKTTEVEICHPAARLLGTLLQYLFGHEVVFTPSLCLPKDTIFDRHDRAAWANKEGADLFISSHANASESHAAEGAEVYYSTQKWLAEELARAIAIIPRRRRGAKKASFTVLAKTVMPAVLIEWGFVDDNDGDDLDDRKWLKDHLAEQVGAAAVIIDQYLRGVRK